MPCDVFLSYSRLKVMMDPKAVPAFRKHLQHALWTTTGDVGLTVFLDTADILAGDDWKNRLGSELESARVLIVLLSPPWLKRKRCHEEYELYQSFAPPRPVVPVFMEQDQRAVSHAKTVSDLSRARAIAVFSVGRQPIPRLVHS
jgi:hypothetical protein